MEWEEERQRELLSAVQHFAGPLAILLAAAYGFWRVRFFNPFADSNYRTWLLATPWSPSLRLPRGTAYPVWEDAIAVGVLTAIGFAGGTDLLPLIGFVFIYAGLTQLLAASRTGTYVATFLWASVILLHEFPWAMLAVLAAILLTAVVSLHAKLRTLPRQDSIDRESRLKRCETQTTLWPMGPAPARPPIAMSHRYAWPLLIGWWTYCVLASVFHLPGQWDRDVAGLILACTMHGFMLGMFRWVTYCGQYQPPISTWGRIWTGRWIIPAHDYVLLAPLTVPLVSGLLCSTMYTLGASPAVAAAVSITTAWWLALNLGPSLAKWRLTGAYRYVRTNKRKHPNRSQSMNTLMERSPSLYM